MNVELISVGTELLLGDIVNTNAQFLSLEMAKLGLNVFYQTSVGDNPERLVEAFKIAYNRADIVIFTGGLGPTDDDLTKETIFDLLGLRAELHTPSYEKIRAYFHKMGQAPTKQNEKQAMFPKGAIIFPNDVGTAPGCSLESSKKAILFLPGPPTEMKTMYNHYVKDYMDKFKKDTIVSKTLKVVGIGESALEPKIKRFLNNPNPTVAIYAKEGTVEVRVTAKANNSMRANEMITEMVRQLKIVIGDFMYSENGESLSEVVVKLLTAKNYTIATCESCTGGLLAGALTEVAGASKIIEGGLVTYANEIKEDFAAVNPETLQKYGAVSVQTAEEMSVGVLDEIGAHLGIAITGIAGPGGGTREKPVGLVYISLTDGEKIYTQELRLPNLGREAIRKRTVTSALNMVRLYLIGRLRNVKVADAPPEEERFDADEDTQRRTPRKKRNIVLRVILQVLLYICFTAFVISAWELGKGMYKEKNSNNGTGTAQVQGIALGEDVLDKSL